MVRLFGLMLALASLVAPANAALLVSYTFDTNASATVDGSVTSTGGSASAFNAGGSQTAGGSVSSGAWVTGALASTTANTFKVTAGSVDLTFESLVFDVRRAGSANVPVKVYYKIDNGTAVDLPDGVFTATSSSQTGLDMGAFSALVPAGKAIEFFFEYTGGTNRSVQLDNIQLSGPAVPEPASIAIFGLMGAGLAARRIRRKA